MRLNAMRYANRALVYAINLQWPVIFITALTNKIIKFICLFASVSTRINRS